MEQRDKNLTGTLSIFQLFVITEVDIDSFIRAKGAIFSAIRTMMVSLDFDISMIDHVYVTGGIGSGINMKYAAETKRTDCVPG